MSFKDKTFEERFKDRMWDHSERAFETEADRQGWRWKRFGLGQDDDELDSWMFPPFIRFMPDYKMQIASRGRPLLVEIQGTGKDRTHKFKLDKLENMGAWNRHLDVWYWLWDNNEQHGTMISYNQLQLMVARGGLVKDSFDGGKRPYWAIPVAAIVEASDWKDGRRYE